MYLKGRELLNAGKLLKDAADSPSVVVFLVVYANDAAAWQTVGLNGAAQRFKSFWCSTPLRSQS
jgi:hypothetical protein